MPFFATASSVGRLLFFGGQSITRGLTLVCMASRILRPARSIAVARLKLRSMIFALRAAIIERITSGTLPPAR